MNLWAAVKAALASGAWKSWALSVIAIGGAFGILDSDQVTLANNLVASLVTLVAVAMALLHTFHAARLLQVAALPRITPPLA